MSKILYKGKKYYAIVNPKWGEDNMNWADANIEETKKGLDSQDKLLLEMTVTRVFTRERDLKEIENDLPTNK